MHHPAHIDGCNVVIIRQLSGLLGGYEVLESGWLSFDGETITLESDCGASRRIFTGEEQQSLLNVSDSSHIRECAGYQFFVLVSQF